MRRNILLIKDDSIRIHGGIPLDSMDVYMYRHFLNRGKSYLFSEDPSKAVVFIGYENHNIDNLEMVIDKVTSAYAKLNLEEPLILILTRPKFLY